MRMLIINTLNLVCWFVSLPLTVAAYILTALSMGIRLLPLGLALLLSTKAERQAARDLVEQINKMKEKRND